jgi:hypothetical protein
VDEVDPDTEPEATGDDQDLTEEPGPGLPIVET